MLGNQKGQKGNGRVDFVVGDRCAGAASGYFILDARLHLI